MADTHAADAFLVRVGTAMPIVVAGRAPCTFLVVHLSKVNAAVCGLVTAKTGARERTTVVIFFDIAGENCDDNTGREIVREWRRYATLVAAAAQASKS